MTLEIARRARRRDRIVRGAAALNPTADFFFPLALHSHPLLLLTLTCGSALGWQRRRAADMGAHFLLKRMLADHLIGAYSKGALGRPSNPGSRGLVARQHLLRVPYH